MLYSLPLYTCWESFHGSPYSFFNFKHHSNTCKVSHLFHGGKGHFIYLIHLVFYLLILWHLTPTFWAGITAPRRATLVKRGTISMQSLPTTPAHGGCQVTFFNRTMTTAADSAYQVALCAHCLHSVHLRLCSSFQ